MSEEEVQTIEFHSIDLKESLGQGGFGYVYRAEWNNRQVAVKESRIHCVTNYYEREVAQLSRVDHPNIIKLFGVSSDDRYYYLILEYAECGTLDALLHGNIRRNFNEGHELSWALQCAEAVAYLNNMTPKPLLHRDLKPENVLLADKYRKVKLCDFGTVVELKTLMTKKQGTVSYMAPEVMLSGIYSMKCDVYSLGIVLWEIKSRQKPFSHIINSNAKMNAVTRGERPFIPDNWPTPLKELIASCWDNSPDKRPTMQKVVGTLSELMPSYPDSNIPIE